MNFCTNFLIKGELSEPLETVTYGEIDYNLNSIREWFFIVDC